MQNKLFNRLFKDEDGKYTLEDIDYKTLIPLKGGFTSLRINVEYSKYGFNINIYIADTIAKSLCRANTNLIEVNDKEQITRVMEVRENFIMTMAEVLKATDFRKIYKTFRSINAYYLTTLIMNEIERYTPLIPILNDLPMIHAQFNLVPVLIRENIMKELDMLNLAELIVETVDKIISYDGVPNYKKKIITMDNDKVRNEAHDAK